MGNGNSSEFNGLDKPISANKVRKYFHKNFVEIGANIRSTKKKITHEKNQLSLYSNFKLEYHLLKQYELSEFCQ